jgi:hypothetical protein
MNPIRRDPERPDQEATDQTPRLTAGRREALRSLATAGMTVLAALGLGTTRAADQGTHHKPAKRRKRRRAQHTVPVASPVAADEPPGSTAPVEAGIAADAEAGAGTVEA